MKRLFALALLLATSCATERDIPAATAHKADSVLVAAGLPPLSIRKLVVRGPLIVQSGQGNTASVADNRKAGQRGGSAATAPGAVATSTTRRGGVPWWVFGLVAVGAVVGWEYVSHQLKPLSWLPWRRPSAP